MNSRRLLLVVGIIGAVSALLLSTGGASSITSTHNLDVVTTADRDAYLGVEQTTRIADETTEFELTVRNQHPSATVFTALEVTINGTTVDLADGSQLEPGTAATHTFRSVDCGQPVRVTAVSADVSVHIERSVVCR